MLEGVSSGYKSVQRDACVLGNIQWPVVSVEASNFPEPIYSTTCLSADTGQVWLLSRPRSQRTKVKSDNIRTIPRFPFGGR
jgi:hypothetical protein